MFTNRLVLNNLWEGEWGNETLEKLFSESDCRNALEFSWACLLSIDLSSYKEPWEGHSFLT
jgi:hypothetical protein